MSKEKDLILEKLLSNQLEGYGTDVWINEPPLRSDKLHNAWKENQNNLTGKIIINPHTAYYSQEAFMKAEQKHVLHV